MTATSDPSRAQRRDEDAARRSRRVAEQSRERDWRGGSFVRELFLGAVKPELLYAADDPAGEPLRPDFQRFLAALVELLRTQVDPAEIDACGEYPRHVLDGLAKIGAFGMKIPTRYAGLGLSHREYVRVMQVLGSYDANITALLSAHQAIGVPHPVEMFGSEALKQKYLPRCARGAISAFALTEPSVGSDPARLGTLARAATGSDYFVLDGHKLWCTNGTLAEVIVVIARDPDTDHINAFVVDMDWEGVRVEHRCHFMGLRALANAEISFRGVRVPRENMIGEPGAGLRVALATLNTGRLTLPAATAGAAKLALELCRKWASVRVQWGQPIGMHEAVAHRLSDMASQAYAMESVAEVLGVLADRPDRDIRLEAAAGKEWNTVTGWELTDSALQIRGGRGYETERSLAARGEPAAGLERMLRDCRINRIFEGSSEIMHLFIAREAVDKHLQVAGKLVDPELSRWTRLAALPRIVAFYARWYPALWLGRSRFRRNRGFGQLAPHLRYAERTSRRLARGIFHGMLRFGTALEHKQAFLFRAVDVALMLFAMVATLLRSARREHIDPGGVELAVRFAQDSRRRIDALLHAMWHNDDDARRALGQRAMRGRYAWLERHTIGLPYAAEALRPPSVEELLAGRVEQPEAEPSDAEETTAVRPRQTLGGAPGARH